MLDEPTNHLDVRHQLEFLELVRGLGITVIAALHGLDVAATYAGTAIVLDRGRTIHIGPPKDVLTERTLLEVFGVESTVDFDADPGRPRFSLRLRCVRPAQPCHWSCRIIRVR